MSSYDRVAHLRVVRQLLLILFVGNIRATSHQLCVLANITEERIFARGSRISSVESAYSRRLYLKADPRNKKNDPCYSWREELQVGRAGLFFSPIQIARRTPAYATSPLPGDTIQDTQMKLVSPLVIRSNGIVEDKAPRPVRRAVYERDHYTCRDCGRVGTPGTRAGDIQAFHLVAVRSGGDHSVDNMITLCTACRRRRDRSRRGYARVRREQELRRQAGAASVSYSATSAIFDSND